MLIGNHSPMIVASSKIPTPFMFSQWIIVFSETAKSSGLCIKVGRHLKHPTFFLNMITLFSPNEGLLQ
tara:strand:- start:54 stop:257 length:204 start_codon:yes stop_codon:yes gene_type:complete